MSKSTIEWTQATWNPTIGCSKISEGCKNCYAIRMAWRHSHNPMQMQNYDGTVEKQGTSLNWTGAIHENTKALSIPKRRKTPTTFFVDSMSDLFHEGVSLEYIKWVFEIMNKINRHTYQVLTKRPENVLRYNDELLWTPNIWMGVSVENEKAVGRIDLLRNTGAQVKFLSVEPLLGPIPNMNLEGIDWVIVGGESGPGAREIKPEWVLDIKDQCKSAGVAFFFKQWGMKKFNPDPADPTINKGHENHAKGGCLLDGQIYHEMPILIAETV